MHVHIYIRVAHARCFNRSVPLLRVEGVQVSLLFRLLRNILSAARVSPTPVTAGTRTSMAADVRAAPELENGGGDAKRWILHSSLSNYNGANSVLEYGLILADRDYNANPPSEPICPLQ